MNQMLGIDASSPGGQQIHVLKQSRFRLNIKKNFLTVRTVRRWNRLPRDVMESPLLVILRGGWISTGQG